MSNTSNPPDAPDDAFIADIKPLVGIWDRPCMSKAEERRRESFRLEHAKRNCPPERAMSLLQENSDTLTICAPIMASVVAPNVPMTADERRALIEAPFPTFNVYGPSGRTGGVEFPPSVIENGQWIGRDALYRGRRKPTLNEYDMDYR